MTMGPWVCARWCQPPSVRETPTEGTQAHGSLAASNHRSTSHKCLSSKGNWGAERERVGLRGGGPPGSRHFESHSGHLSAGRRRDFTGGRGCPGPAVSPQSSPLPWPGGIRAAFPGLPPSSSLGEPPPSEMSSRGGVPRPRCLSNSVQAPKIHQEEEEKRKLAASCPRLGVRPPATAATIRVALGEE